jgi:hypothetical protein
MITARTDDTTDTGGTDARRADAARTDAAD